MEGLNNPTKEPLHSSSSSNRNETYPVGNSRGSRLAAADHESIDNSLFSHAISAAKLIEEAVKADSSERASSTALEMRSALDTLQLVVDAQKRRNATNEDGPLFPRSFPPNTPTRNPPIPPIDKIMACLRMAQGAYGACTPSTLSILSES